MSKFENYKDYFYDNTEVLKNLLDIRDEKLLNDTERRLVSIRISEINKELECPVQGSFDFDHLKRINKFLFQDLYEWAGDLRKCEMEKIDVFCLYSNLEYFANVIFSKIKEENYYIDYDYDDKIAKLVDLFGDINALHPFREGNGRTQREFIEELAKVNGISLDLTRIGQNTMIEASHRSMNGDNSVLYELFKECSNPISLKYQIYNVCHYCEPRLQKKLNNNLLAKSKKR